MKQLLLTIVLTGLLLSAYSQDKYEPNDTAIVATRGNETVIEKFRPQNNYAFGFYGSSKLPLGYQMFFNLENIGRHRVNMGLLFNNQFSSHSNYDISCTVLKRNVFLNNGTISDIANLNFRTRKLHFSDKERITENYKAGYGFIIRQYNLLLGADCERGKEDVNGMLITAGRFLSKPRINLTAQTSWFHDRTDYRAGISKTFSFNTPSIYAIEVFYEEYRGYNDVSVGLMIYLH